MESRGAVPLFCSAANLQTELWPATIDDAAVVGEWAKDADFHAAFPELDPRERAGVHEFLARRLALPESPLFLVGDGRQCRIGLAALRVSLRDARVAQIAYAIAPRERGRGHGTRAAHLLVTEASRAGRFALHATVRAENIPSRRILYRLGFVRVALDAACAAGEPSLHYRLMLRREGGPHGF